VSENKVPRKIFGPQRDEVTGACRRQHNKEHSDFYSSPNIIRGNQTQKNGIGRTCDMYGGWRGCIEGFGRET
jgi:hypothetical protein